MDVLYAVILGVIEGVTEFLPISSTGHMVIAMPLMGLDAERPPWSVLLWVSQFGAIAAVIVYFWRDLWQRVLHAPRRWQDHLLTKLAAAMVPTVALALVLKPVLDPLEKMPVMVAGALIVGAVAMEFIDRRFRRNAPQTLDDVTLPQALIIGAFQCLSMWPGVSRSGATIMTGMVLGLSPRVATEFSFYLAVPTMLAAAAKTLWSHRHELSGGNAGLVLTGTATAFVVALVVIAGFLDYVRRYRFTPFVIYRIALGAAVLIYAWGAPRG